MASFTSTKHCTTRFTRQRTPFLSVPGVRPGGAARARRLVTRAEGSVLEKVTQVVKDQLGVDDVSPENTFQDDLGADSLDTVEIVMALEEEFGVEVPEEEAEKISTVGQAVEMIEAKMGKGE